jgi:hypothetical protein
MDDYIAKPVTLNELRDVLVRNWPGAAGPVMPVAEGPKRELVDLERFNSVSRDASGAMDPDAFEIFRGAMTELPARWERMAKLSGSDLVKDAHNLKGMVSVFGFSALADELARLEREASTLNADQVVERVSSIRSLCADSLVELGRLVPEIAG